MKALKVVFYASDKPREHMLAKALGMSVKEHGDSFEMRRTAEYGEDDDGTDRKYPGPTPDTDVAVMFGVKGRSRQIMEDHLALGKSTLYIDKGYDRRKGEGGHTEYSRMSVNASHPANYIMHGKWSEERWNALKSRWQNRQLNPGGHILICTSSQKYCDFHRIGDAHGHADGLISRLKKLTDRHLVYRPKPSDKAARPIAGASYSGGNSTIWDALRGCYCVVTHGASASIDAVIAGIPAITLGQCAASPVCGKELEIINEVFWPDEELRRKWARHLAWTQFTTNEMRNGPAWEHLRKEIVRQHEIRFSLSDAVSAAAETA